MFKIVENRMIVPNINLMTIEAPLIAGEVQAGQFVILRANDDGERIPLSIADWDRAKGTISVVILTIGGTTSDLAAIQVGKNIPTAVGPLGNPTEIEHFGTVLCIGGCYGIASIYPIARALKEKGNRVIAVMEARSSYLLYWEDKLEKVSDRLIRITRDGTKGYRGHVSKIPGIMQEAREPVDRIIINGCTFLMKRSADASRPYGIKTIVSLNPIMIDGTGMCGVCRVSVGSATKFACVDGPDFDGHEVDWKELLQRRKTYLKEETIVSETSRCEDHALKTRDEAL